MLVSTFTFPDIERCTPVTVSADAPVLYIFQPVSKAALSDALRDPVDRIIIMDQVVFHLCHTDKPGLSCIVDQRSIASPAMRVTMLKLRRGKEQSSLFQIFQDHRIGFLAKYTCKRSLLCHFPFSVYKLYKWHIIAASHLGIVLTECRRDMNHASTVSQCNIGITQHIKCLFMLLLGCFCRSVIERDIFFPFQISPDIFLQNLISRLALFFCKSAKHLIKKRLCHIVYTAVRCLYFGIRLLWIHTECHIRRQRPRSCRPRKDVSVLIFYFKANDG